MRIQRILLGAALLMLCAAAAYAQITVSSTPVTTVISSGRAEAAGALRLSASSAGALADTITVRYGGLSITNQLSGTNIDTGGGWACTYVTQNNLAGIITISCPAAAANAYFQVNGVRLNMDGYAGSNVVATIGTLINPVIAGQNTATVINSIAPGMVPQATGNTTAVYLSNQNDITDWGELYVTEGFASAWKTTGQAGTSATNGTRIRVTLAGLASNMRVDVYAYGSGSLTPVIVSGGTLSSSTTQTVISFSNTDPAVVETLDIYYEPYFTSDAPLPVQSWYMYVTLDPVQDALNADGTIVSSNSIPKFARINLPAAGFQAITVTPNTTSLIVPYLSTDSGFNTGIALANTTADPFGAYGAIPQNGAVTVTFYPNDGTAAITYNSATDGVVGKGLTSAGILNSGSTWTVLATEMLTKKGRTTPFSGYAIVVLNATNGHGVSYVSNFGGFTSASPMLVMTNPQIWERGDPFLGRESLAQ